MVLLGQNQTVSLIIVLSEVHFVPPAEDALKNIPPNSAVVYRWTVFTQWEKEKGDTGSYEQAIGISSDAGVVSFTNVAKFAFQDNANIQRLAGNFEVFPMLPAGRYELTLQWRKEGSVDWIEGGRYPIYVIFDPPRQFNVPFTAPKP
jgi:hypothetical protein